MASPGGAGTSTGKQRLVVLDGLRGVAAFAVALYHFLYLSRSSYGHVIDGDLAVDFFFCLSGFVLAHANGDALAGGVLSIGRFLRMRIVRLWPMVFVGTLVGMAALPFSRESFSPAGRQIVPTILLSVCALPLWTGGRALWINGVFWSLISELFANACYAAAARRLDLIALAASCITMALLFGAIAHHLYYAAPHLETPAIVPATMLRACLSFFLGVLVHRLWRQHGDRLPRLSPLLVSAMLASVLLIPMHRAMIWIALGSIVLLFPLIVLLGATARLERPALMEFAGDASFPLYGLHAPLAAAAAPLLRPMAEGRKAVFALAIVCLLVPVSVWLARGIEKRFIRRLRSLLLAPPGNCSIARNRPV